MRRKHNNNSNKYFFLNIPEKLSLLSENDLSPIKSRVVSEFLLAQQLHYSRREFREDFSSDVLTADPYIALIRIICCSTFEPPSTGHDIIVRSLLQPSELASQKGKTLNKNW